MPNDTEQEVEQDCDDEVLLKAVKEGKVDSRGALGMRFDRCLDQNPSIKENYRNTRALVAKQQFRLQWARTQLETVVQQKRELQQKSHTDISRGEHEPFSNVVKHEGGKDRQQTTNLGGEGGRLQGIC